ncbi:LysR family transcriptional regulator transcriptional regulator [Bordetella ansorpii]|uniref:LysR family transcriptional regulator transcriptional regulator n=1 Tax=Bordetella ansorpii TaxID=288768 RepID=A0A157S789_9BORD|nr:LysR family transcriptional regulator [Bordetella ansorpii]SAI66259.1 LysR family transcriptional regulator transcriptional regulator [Bordetella ansorpii]
MDLNRLLTLRELARCGTMAAAAESLHLSPSAISQQIAQFERELDTALTERRGRGVALTPAGEALVRHAERIMGIVDEARSELAQLRDDVAGELRVAAFPSVAVAVLAHAVQALKLEHPRLNVVVQEMEPQEGLSALGAWHTDVAIIDDLAADPSGRHDAYELLPLAQDAMHILVPAGHPLAQRPFLRVADLRDESWALDSTYSSFGEFIGNLCRRAGFAPRINAHCTGFEMVAAMVASGCSVSIASGMRMVRPLPGVRAIKMRPEIQRRILLAIRKGERDHPAVQACVQALQTSAALAVAKRSAAQASQDQAPESPAPCRGPAPARRRATIRKAFST